MYVTEGERDTTGPPADRAADPVKLLAEKLELPIHVQPTFTGWEVSLIPVFVFHAPPDADADNPFASCP